MPFSTRHFLGPIVGAAMFAAPFAHAATFQTVYSFAGGTDGAYPVASVIQGPDGALYGTTSLGGKQNKGKSFRLDATTGTLRTIAPFGGARTGAFPGSRLVFDLSGKPYGTAGGGPQHGLGTIYTLNPKKQTVTLLYTFRGAPGGSGPSGLVVADDGMMYGTTGSGGTIKAASWCQKGCGTLFRFDPQSGIVTTLYAFHNGGDGALPQGSLVIGKNGDLYGATMLGGQAGNGTLFKFDPVSKSLTTLYAFTGGTDGAWPRGGLIFDASGALYGATLVGPQALSNGILFRFDPSTGKLTTLHAFTGGDGQTPNGNLTLGSAGEIYGTTVFGGQNNVGTVFKFDPSINALTTLHSFSGFDGQSPQDGVALSSNATLYGTTYLGGFGTIFKLTP